MANYDGHVAKRQKTDGDNRSAYGQFGDSYGGGGGYNNRNRGSEEEKVNHILLMTIQNPAYPITVDVIQTICSPSGKVQRIVIFKKNGVQAMVEFDSIESAKRAKESLNGADIYSGCCTLKIEYAKPTRLNVHKNDNESWDYTNPSLGKMSDRPALLQEPRGYGSPPYRDGAPRGPPAYPEREPYDSYGSRPVHGYGNDYGPPPRPQTRYGSPLPDRYGRYEREIYDGRVDGPPPPGPPSRGPLYGPGPAPGGPGGPQQGSVVMIYGLAPDKINADRLFNLFCLYGNVVRVKFLKSKEGCAMIQMGDPLSVERTIANLNGVKFFGSKIQLGYSKQAFLNDVQQPFSLPDGSPSFKDFMGNRNNRFTNPESAGKNRIQPPSKILHFFNAPYGIKEEELKKVFEDAEVKSPITIKMFPSKTERSSSGLLEFENLSDSLEALVMCNHTPISNQGGKFPYILKLCFSFSSPRS
ncbi:heterogeneous nuclear ribonucleoprotein L-like isoform X1 [Centruroides vittatus]|uniref:heterogeneous nuclear ribonucleoprotein L-like isoform X1 n=1 Tax=Centruroides vittatus TaxID=120091 RepID=UPI00350EDBCB